MSTLDFIIELFCRVDDLLGAEPKHPQASLYPSEVLTLALLFALKGCSTRAFYRWLRRDYGCLFPRLPERNRLFRLFAVHQDWTDYLLAEPTVLGVADTYGIELLHPYREGRSARQLGRKGLSNHRWIVGAKLCFVLNQWGLVAGWSAATANVHDSSFQPTIAAFAEEMIILTDHGFYSKAGNPANMKVCARGRWGERMVVERVLAMLTSVCHCKKMSQRVWRYFVARLAYTMVLFNVLAQWRGLPPDENGRIHLSIAEFSL